MKNISEVLNPGAQLLLHTYGDSEESSGIKDNAGATWEYVKCDQWYGVANSHTVGEDFGSYADTSRSTVPSIRIKNGLIQAALADSIDEHEDGTIAFWMYNFNNNNKADAMVTQKSNIAKYGLSIYANNSGLGFGSYANPIFYSNPSKIFKNQWHHVAVTRKNEVFRFFVDGRVLWRGPFAYRMLAEPVFRTDCWDIQYSTPDRISVDAMYNEIIVVKGQALWEDRFSVKRGELLFKDGRLFNKEGDPPNRTAIVSF